MQDSPIDIELVARVCHEVNRVIQLSTGEEVSRSYDKATNLEKASSNQGVLNALAGQTPEELHDSWCENKLRDGWTYGPVKNEKYKQHPCLIPYEELDFDQKMKDFAFHAVVRAFYDDHKEKTRGN